MALSRDGPTERLGSASIVLLLALTGGGDTDDWVLTGRGEVVSDVYGQTHIAVAVKRIGDDVWQPDLTGSFDGSGGGEARDVACSTFRSWRWDVDPGQTEPIELDCDTYVSPEQFANLTFVYAGAKGPVG